MYARALNWPSVHNYYIEISDAHVLDAANIQNYS